MAESFSAVPIFVAVVERGSFSAAGEALGLSKSAVSKRVTQLEAQLGMRLLHRTTRKLSLTEAGERYYRHASQAAACVRDAEDAVSELQGEPCGYLKVNVPMSFGLLNIMPEIAEFMARYPKIDLDVVLDDKPVDLVDQGYDLAIRPGDLADSSLIARRLCPLRSVVCCAPGYREQKAVTSLQAPNDLSEENCLVYSYSSNANDWSFTEKRENGKTFQLKVQGDFRVNSSEALKSAIENGQGIGRLPSFVAAKSIQEGRLERLFADYRMPEKSLYALYPARDYLPAKVRAFVDFAVEKIQPEPLWDQGLFD